MINATNFCHFRSILSETIFTGMKKILLLSFTVLLLFACKKTEYSPEGPTDVRIRNLSDLDFNEVILKTSEYDEDVDTLPDTEALATTEYFRFRKAYPKIEISAKITIGSSPVKFSTGTVDFTYMHYLGRDRVTYEVYISDLNARVLKISKVIPEEELVLK